MYIINETSLKKIAPVLPQTILTILPLLIEIPPKYGIDTAKKFCPFLANLLHESGDFIKLSENLNYAADKVRAIFGKHRISVEDANKYGRTATQKANQQMIANIVYGGKFGLEELGNTLPGDGWLFRGSGYMQITGRANTAAFAAYYNNLTASAFTPEQMAEMLRTKPLIAMHGACWFFSIYKKLIPFALKDDFETICKRINGGKIGFDERLQLLKLCQANIAETA